MVQNNPINYWDLLGKLPKCSDCPSCSSEPSIYLIAHTALTSSRSDYNSASTAITNSSNDRTHAQKTLGEANINVALALAAEVLACAARDPFNPVCISTAAAAIAAVNSRANARNALDIANLSYEAALNNIEAASTQYKYAQSDFDSADQALSKCQEEQLACLENCCP
jgi:aspartokinase